MPKVRTVPIDSLILDSRNANKGTKRGGKLLTESLARYGVGRSILVDRKGHVIAGNKTLETAKAAGLKHVALIETDGDTLVAVQRKDVGIETKKGRELAIADNRSSELNLEWDADILKGLDLDLSQFWDEDELVKILGNFQPGTEEEQSHLDITVQIVCPKCGHKFRRD